MKYEFRYLGKVLKTNNGKKYHAWLKGVKMHKWLKDNGGDLKACAAAFDLGYAKSVIRSLDQIGIDVKPKVINKPVDKLSRTEALEAAKEHNSGLSIRDVAKRHQSSVHAVRAAFEEIQYSASTKNYKDKVVGVCWDNILYTRPPLRYISHD